MNSPFSSNEVTVQRHTKELDVMKLRWLSVRFYVLRRNVWTTTLMSSVCFYVFI